MTPGPLPTFNKKNYTTHRSRLFDARKISKNQYTEADILSEEQQ
jgi:hypothetical protein